MSRVSVKRYGWRTPEEHRDDDASRFGVATTVVGVWNGRKVRLFWNASLGGRWYYEE